MNRRTMLLCVLMGFGMMIGMTSVNADDAKITAGTITQVADDGGSFTLQDEDGNAQDVGLTDDTTYSLNGEDSSRAATVKAGAKATVTHKGGKAMKVAVDE